MKSAMLASLGLLALAAVGCRDETASPTGPASDSPAAAADLVPTAPVFYQLATSGYHSCGIATDGSAWCWGLNFVGELGDGSPYTSYTPVRVTGGHAFRQVSTAGDQTCGVTTDFYAFCWGMNDFGQLGTGDRMHRFTPTPVAGGLRFYQVDTGLLHTCGVSYPDRRAYCWGLNEFGELGDGTTGSRFVPTPVAGGLAFRHVSPGQDVTCAVTTAARAYCWGRNNWGQLGDGGREAQRNRPGPVVGGLVFKQLEVGRSHTCGVTTTDTAYCWGYGRSGEIGDGRTGLRWAPRAVAGGLLFRRVAPGLGFTCA